MTETKIKWNEGDGYITATYEGIGNNSVSISSDINYDIDRKQQICVSTTKGNNKKVEYVLISQNGIRETFETQEGEFILSDGTKLNVLKNELQK